MLFLDNDVDRRSWTLCPLPTYLPVRIFLSLVVDSTTVLLTLVDLGLQIKPNQIKCIYTRLVVDMDIHGYIHVWI